MISINTGITQCLKLLSLKKTRLGETQYRAYHDHIFEIEFLSVHAFLASAHASRQILCSRISSCIAHIKICKEIYCIKTFFSIPPLVRLSVEFIHQEFQMVPTVQIQTISSLQELMSTKLTFRMN
jgi:hypothetical protein